MKSCVSIVVPIYNVKPYLPTCVDSLLSQTLEDIQIILVDDGSTDGCGALCDGYAAKDGRVTVIHKPNGGLVSAWKAGVQAAAADYVGFVDGDDWADPGFFQELYTCAVQTGADIVNGLYVDDFPPETGRPSAVSQREGLTLYRGQQDIRRLTGLFLTSFLYDGVPNKPGRPITYGRWDKLYRRSLLTDNMAYFDERLSPAEDVTANAAMLPDCGMVAVLASQAKYHHLNVPGSMSRRSGQRQLELILAADQALGRVVEEKGLDRHAAAAFVGSMVHARIYRIAGLADMGTAEKCADMGRFMQGAPAGTLEAFVQMRGSAFLRVFYALLRHGLAAPCVWMVRLHGALQRR